MPMALFVKAYHEKYYYTNPSRDECRLAPEAGCTMQEQGRVKVVRGVSLWQGWEVK